jgi:hypothetical protein
MEASMKDFVDNAKGIISVLRDGLITLVLVLLLAFPKAVNDRLNAAGIKKVDVAGVDWEATVKDNNQKLDVAATTIDALQQQVTKTQDALKTSEDARQNLAKQVAAQLPGTAIADVAAKPPPVPTDQIVARNNAVVKTSQMRADVLREQIQMNNHLLESVATAPHQ